MIISVPKSLNLSQSSLVSRWQWIGRRSSELHEPTILGLLCKGEWESWGTLPNRLAILSNYVPALVWVFHRLKGSVWFLSSCLMWFEAFSTATVLPNHYTAPRPHPAHHCLQQSELSMRDLISIQLFSFLFLQPRSAWKDFTWNLSTSTFWSSKFVFNYWHQQKWATWVVGLVQQCKTRKIHPWAIITSLGSQRGKFSLNCVSRKN